MSSKLKNREVECVSIAIHLMEISGSIGNPNVEGLAIATGGSGHGFKFAPIIGSIIGKMIAYYLSIYLFVDSHFQRMLSKTNIKNLEPYGLTDGVGESMIL